MLRLEDCKESVEVIAIKNERTAGGRPLLSIGAIYTICHVGDRYYHSLTNSFIYAPFIGVHEVDESLAIQRGYIGWAYYLHQFKLRDREEFTKLFKLNDIPLSIKNEELQDA